MVLKQIKEELKENSNPEKAKILQRFFKTGKGEYGEGDIFLGISVPCLRKISKKYFQTSFNELKELLNSKIHEERLMAIFILIERYKKNPQERKNIFDFYLDNVNGINNWDLVDLSAPKIIGDFLICQDKKILYELAKSHNLWERRIAIVSTFSFIRENHFSDTFAISEILLEKNEKHDLIHKAVGWMLREIGKRNQESLEIFFPIN